jgi:hypothetical protein
MKGGLYNYRGLTPHSQKRIFCIKCEPFLPFKEKEKEKKKDVEKVDSDYQITDLVKRWLCRNKSCSKPIGWFITWKNMTEDE